MRRPSRNGGKKLPVWVSKFSQQGAHLLSSRRCVGPSERKSAGARTFLSSDQYKIEYGLHYDHAFESGEPSCARIVLMAAACGFAVSTLYYNQPLLPQMGRASAVRALMRS